MVLDILVQKQRNRASADTFLRKVEGYLEEPRVAMTDKNEPNCSLLQ